jgi:hypothetical protein
MSFLDNYEPVADRIAKFWDKYPTGRLHTEIVLINETEIVIKASAFTDREDSRPAAIDFAQETRNSSQINRQSFIENCSTSALGRVLATLNFQPKRDVGGVSRAVRPSREEMQAVTPSKQTARNWASEATVLVGLQDVDGLRKLHAEAKSGGASAEMLKSITDLGKSLSK